jgi:hypothetical protein
MMKTRKLIAIVALLAGTGGSIFIAGGSAASALATASGSGHPDGGTPPHHVFSR